MFVPESPDSLHATVRGTTYYFCSESCLKTFLVPERELRSLKQNVALSFILGIPILVLSYIPIGSGFLAAINNWILLALATPVQFIAGWRFYQGTWNAIKMRSSNMDTLIAVGTSAAYFYSLLSIIFPNFIRGGTYFDTSAIIIALILTGRLLEYTVRGKASDAIRKLMDLQPKTATVVRKENEIQIPVEEVEVGDIMIVKPGEKIPTDGEIVDGHSFIDQKSVTGESIPVEKSTSDAVIGATINKSGLLKVRATKVGQDTTLSKIVQLVQEAQASKGPVERLVNTVATYFVPLVILVAAISFLAWYFLGPFPQIERFAFGFTAAVSVLIIACPCALGLATPAAIVVGAGKGAENGILIKGGEYLERAQKITTVVFDKTGTLTKGEPSVTDVIPVHPTTSDKNKDSDKIVILSLAAMAEKGSEHPLAQAILREAQQEGATVEDPSSFEAIAGHGVVVKDRVGRRVLLGNAKLMERENVPIDDDVAMRLGTLQGEGKTSMLLAADGRISGIVAVADVLKENSKEAVYALKKMGLQVIMLTGDNGGTAKAIATQVGIDKYFAEVLPDEKASAIKKLQSEGKIVAMVGDGVNDAPALAQADIGISIGSGSDIAVESGGLILMRDDLRDVAAGIQLSRKTMRKIKENLFWAFIYNVGLIPVAAGGLYFVLGFLLNPIFAGAAMALSSVTVVTNSLTLRNFKPKLS